MKEKILDQILIELDKGRSFTDISQLYQIISPKLTAKDDEYLKEKIKKWWDKLMELIYLCPELDISERSFSPNGILLDKKNEAWVRNETTIFPQEHRILQYYLTSAYNVEVNYRTPFISFSAVHNHYKYRISMQILKRYPTLKIKTFVRFFRNKDVGIESFNLSKNLLNTIINSNVLISGSTGSGKTTLLRALLNHVPEKEHKVIIEDLNELEIEDENTTHLCSQQIGLEMNELVTNSLRMSPDRIVLGEIRSKEIVPFILALNSGHSGSMATTHANSAVDTIYRLVELIQVYGNFGDNNNSQMMKLVSRNIDYVIFLENKEIKEIIKIKGASEKGAPFFELIYMSNNEKVITTDALASYM